MKVKFTEDYTVKDEFEKDPKKSTQYQKGKTYELDEASASHFIGRGRAVAVAPAKKG